MCGIVGVVSNNPVNQLLYDALLLLQHRGQDAAGIATNHSSMFSMHKANGLVRDVFRTRNMRSLQGNSGIGHCRYPTAGSSSEEEAQPFYVNAPFGITLAHNGNLTNQEQLKSEMFRNDRRHINTDSDSEVLLNVLAHEIQEATTGLALDPDAVFKAVAAVHRRVRGAYAVVAQIAGHGLLAFRDPFGIRPLCVGVNETDNGTEYLVASESVALEGIGFRFLRDVAPGEARVHRHRRQAARAPVRRQPVAQPVRFRIRVPGASGLDHRRRLGLRHPPEDGRVPGRQGAQRVQGRRHRRRHADSRFVAPGRDPAGAQARRRVPRRLHQEPLHRPHLPDAGPGDPPQVGAPEAQRHRLRIQGQERAAGGRLDRARHHQPRDRPDGARSGRPQRVSSPRPRRRCCSRTCTASTCRPATN